MSEPRPRQRRMTFDEYLAFEDASPTKHEFVDGHVYAMSGASTPHNRIVLNLVVRLDPESRQARCRLYALDVKLRIGDDVYYPDFMVVCEPGGEDERMAYQPCLLVEVTSPSTSRTDRARKLAAYQSPPSLRAYLMVSQRERRVVRHWRAAEGAPWQVEEVTGDGRVRVPCPLPGELTLEEIYRDLGLTRPALRRVREPAPA